MHRVPPPVFDPRYTLGVVIPVPEPARGQLHRWREHYGTVDHQQVAPHITLVTGSHLGPWPQAAAHVRRVADRERAFRVRLGAARSFRPASQVVYLPLLAGSGNCHRLHRDLLAGPLQHDSQFDFHPHLTITQNAAAPQLDAALGELQAVDLDFTVDEIQLFDMHDGQWNLIERIVLG